ncbi:MAG TPA: carboxypeptidase-like regulatory domain-containing protein, partial [Vicinamibacterales bacterium]|nr:carboxypeptidase-like regulatory domain-containing protein [Vicinamibacterales bacterium]
MRTRILALSTLLLIVSAVTIDGRQAGRRDLRTEPLRGTGAIAGFVVDEASGQPLRRVEVTLIATDQAQRHVSYTDAAGSFTFPNLPPGRYSLAASKPGWLRAAYGARRHDRRGTPIHLAAGQALTNVRLGTNKGGVITGQILDETGLPAFGVQVRALEYRTVLGERRLAPVAGMTGALFGETTDDRGTFRLYGLPPGDYVVVATPRLSSNVELVAMTDAEIRAALQAAQQPPQPAATVGAHTTAREPAARRDDGVTVGFAPVYYPGTTAVSSASAVTLGVGEERGSVDFQLQLVRTGRIEGLVVPPPGAPPQGVQVMLMPETEAGGIGLMGMSILNRATPDAEGRFTFRSVVPGRYVLSARAVQGAPGAAPAPVRTMVFQASGGGAPMMMGDGGSDRPAFWASNDITMSGENIDNQVLSLQPAMTMSGTVQFAGKAAAPSDLTGVRLRIVPAPSAGQQVIMG